ncbi:group II intron maturase-specific domain-containing protein [Methyloglobulus morosus]|uniref:group II intron maturase-specific domain-containing protein n=1 Tax=Methyloglobulus morosus TaxID=1410681 RepID=UPI003898F012
MFDKHINDSNRVVLGNIIFQVLGKQCALHPVIAFNEPLHLPPRLKSCFELILKDFQRGSLCFDTPWTLRGWYAYFQHAHRFTFPTIDGFVHRRLRAMLRRQKHRPGQGRCLNDHKQWPNAFFADLGLFTMSNAHRLARQSR